MRIRDDTIQNINDLINLSFPAITQIIMISFSSINWNFKVDTTFSDSCTQYTDGWLFITNSNSFQNLE